MIHKNRLRDSRAGESIYTGTDGRSDRPAFSLALQGAGGRTSLHGDGQREGNPVQE